MMKFLPIFVTLLPYFANAANDWSKPCFQGMCSYDVAPSDTSMSASMTIGGSTKAISDITPAAGWEIMGCDPNAVSQDIRLVCKSSDATSVGCDHLYQNGAENTIVRLPENCLKVPFARVARAWVPADQSIPTSIAHRIMRRDTPQVHALTLDTNWTAAAGNQDGNVTLSVIGLTTPGEKGNANITPPPTQRRSRVQPRVISLPPLGNPLNSIPFNQNITLPTFDVDAPFTLFNKSIACPGTAEASVVLKGNAIAHANFTLGVSAIGTLVPPSLNDLALTTTVSAQFGGLINLHSAASGSLDSGLLPLFEDSIAGLNIPHVISLAPVFQLNGQATADLDVDINMDVEVEYVIQNLQIVFPPPASQNFVGSVTPLDTPITLSVSPQVASEATIAVHLIPTVSIAVNAFDGRLGSAQTVVVSVDANTNLQLNLSAQGQGVQSDVSNFNGTVNGCVDIHNDVTASARALGGFLSLFNASTTAAMTSVNYSILHKCFGASAGNVRRSAGNAVRAPPFEKRDFGCPFSDLPSTVVGLVEETVPSDDITQISPTLAERRA